jgi:hypothetical protein
LDGRPVDIFSTPATLAGVAFNVTLYAASAAWLGVLGAGQTVPLRYMTCINRSQPPPPSPSVEYVANGSVAYSFSWFNWRLLQSLPPAPSVASCVAGGLFSFASLPRPSPALGLGAGFLSARCAVAYESTNTLSAFTTAAVSSIDVPSMLELASFVYNATNGTITTFFQQVLYFPLVTSLRRLAGCFFPPLWRRLRRNVSAPLYDPSDRRSAATPRSSPRVTINNFFLLTPPSFGGIVPPNLSVIAAAAATHRAIAASAFSFT